MAKRLLQDYGIFEELTSAEQEKLLALAVEREYPAGAVIFKEGDPAEEFLLLEEGKVALQMKLPATLSQAQRKVAVDFVGKDEVLGWSAIVEPHVYTLTAVTLQRAKVLAINGSKLRSLMEADHHLGCKLLVALIKVVASRLADTREVLASERLVTITPM